MENSHLEGVGGDIHFKKLNQILILNQYLWMGLIQAYLPKYVGLFDEKTLLNRKCQILVSQTQACGVSIQRQCPVMLADCAQIFILVSESLETALNGLISKCTLKLGRRGLYLKIHSPNFKSEHNPPTLLAIASGYTPHMTMFGQQLNFIFKNG